MLRPSGALLMLAGCDLVFPLNDSSTPQACEHEGLELCLVFDHAAGAAITRDNSARLHDGKLTDVGTVEREPGEQAIDLTGDSEIVFEYNNVFDLAGPMSIDLWVQFSGFTGSTQFILDNDRQFSIGIRKDANVVDCGFLTTNGVADTFANNVLPDRWHHIACVMGETQTNVFLDGQDAGQPRDLDGRTLNTGGNRFLFIGHRGDETLEQLPFTGQIDNVRIWNRALTVDEISRFAMNIEEPL